MLTLFLQSLSALGIFAFAAVIAAVYRALPEHDPRRGGWLAVAIVLGVYATSAVASGTFAVAAFFSGAGSTTWEAFLRLAPAATFGRLLLAYVLSATLVSLAIERAVDQARRNVVWAACGAAVVGGAVIGVWHGPMGPAHFGTVAMMQAIGLALFCAALLLVLRRDTLDASLWLALAAQCFSWALDAPLIAILSLGAPVGLPPPWVAMAIRVVFIAVSLTLVVHRLAEARASAVPRTRMLAADARTA